ncbi:DNA-directed RNA polymerase subunit alpha [Helicobacter canadensis]|uniref:DNA-directed RNA polymerase subunit alpha n=1 Tax=Helicobacter canadensis MIT 98-5491 TaxID=537970 RepID=C5ZZ57_9HELI|nr:DNA-directed RNA polymerase subunit alpha [Helicobacter canadensis]EES89315.1 DNA-directed RNA polymerase alpha subunit [Helicobacter canadensis MIT 98-5491]EFR48100.1 DNA-directed RNA polymerase, alpha subunit [Helicobacter canadensis MIT 98-5491]STO99350.1 DNA-directed RNA polymerase subunit alpha [Helicobacter canadensis]
MKSIKTSPHIPTKIEVKEVGVNKVQITAYPFENGYAITLAHPLRRLLLGSSVGFAPVALHIAGVAHEFDSVRGVTEDVSQFIVNLKTIRFKIKDDSDSVSVDYTFNGPKVITGADLSNDLVEVVTPDVHLATINKDATLSFSIVIYKGIGYVPSEEIRANVPEGFMPLDAYFTPVTSATYATENMLLEDDPNYEKVIFEIQTDGQVDPLTAFKNALSVMHKQMSIFNSELNIEIPEVAISEEERPELKVLSQTIDSLNFSARCFNCLDRSGIKYLGELVLLNEEQIKNIKNLGKKSLDEITAKLDELGYPVNREISEDLMQILKKKFSN